MSTLTAPAPVASVTPDEAFREEVRAFSYFYNRATSIYGGTSEIQRDLIARGLLR